MKKWLIGAANAVLSGAASGAAAGYVGLDLKKCLIVAGASAAMSLAKWIPQHPIPDGE